MRKASKFTEKRRNSCERRRNSWKSVEIHAKGAEIHTKGVEIHAKGVEIHGKASKYPHSFPIFYNFNIGSQRYRLLYHLAPTHPGLLALQRTF